MTSIDTPDGLYCKLPQDSPITVRGARNYPCMGHPGKAGAHGRTLQRPKGYSAVGDAPALHSGRTRSIPNLIAQGVPPDDRVDFNDRIYRAGGGHAAAAGCGSGRNASRSRPAARASRAVGAASATASGFPVGAPLAGADSAGAAAGNSLNGTPIRGRHRDRTGPPTARSPPRRVRSTATVLAAGGPSVAITHYDPRTGEYLAPDGQLQQADQSGCRGGAQVVEGPAPDLTRDGVGSGRSGQLGHPTGSSMSGGWFLPHAPLADLVMLRPASRSSIRPSRPR